MSEEQLHEIIQRGERAKHLKEMQVILNDDNTIRGAANAAARDLSRQSANLPFQRFRDMIEESIKIARDEYLAELEHDL